MDIKQKMMNRIVVYAQENCKLEKEREYFNDELQSMMYVVKNNELALILGDFNARI